MFWMICYDIVDDRTRLRASRALLRHGERVQRSVYECHLNPREMQALQRELEGIIERTTDRVRFYPMCKRDCAAIRLDGHGPGVTVDEPFRLV